MADYNPILDAETDPEAGLRSSLFKRMVANPIAIAEGAAGAPRLNAGTHRIAAKSAAVNPASSSNATGTVTDFGVFAGFSFTGWGILTTSNDTRTVRIRFSTDNGSNYGGWVTLFTLAGTSGNNRQYSIYLVLDVLASSLSYVTKGWENSGTSINHSAGDVSVSVPTGANAFQINITATSGTATIAGIFKQYGLLE